jgi:hypothetical protein
MEHLPIVEFVEGMDGSCGTAETEWQKAIANRDFKVGLRRGTSLVLDPVATIREFS